MRDIHPGDIVYDEDGKETKVLAESPVVLTNVYSISFQDGTSIKCCKDHLWKYKLAGDSGYKVKSLNDILQLENDKDIFIPINKPIQFSKKELPLSPYLACLFMQYGSIQSMDGNINLFINKIDKNTFDNIYHLVGLFGKCSYTNDNDEYTIKCITHLSSDELMVFHLLIDKVIPKDYLLTNIADRKELFNSLINIYGKDDIFYTDCQQLKNEFIFLARSLGYRTCESFNGIIYTVKLEQYSALKVVDIKKLDYQEEMKCITVNSPQCTYICENFIVTHNTAMLAALVAKFKVKPVAVLADKLSLCTQLQQEFSKFLGEDIGLVGGGIKDQKDITIYSVQSATEDMVKDAKLMMVDECFVYETIVQLANGIKKSIGDIVENFYEQKRPYRVVTFNHETGEKENKTVTAVSKTPLVKELMVILIKDANNKIIKLICTDDHPFYNKEMSAYTPAKELEEGTTVQLLDNTEGKVFKIVKTPRKDQYVYDIEVEDNHNFYANGVLVHNCHHTPADTISQVSRWCKDAYYRIGVSATPWRDDGADLLIDAVFSKQNKDLAINASYLIQCGYLVPCTIYWVQQRQGFKNKKSYNTLYTEAIVNNTERNENIAKIAYQMRKFKDAIILILIQRVEHGAKLLKMLKDCLPNESFSMTVQNTKTGKDTLIRCNSIEFLSGQDDTLKRQAVIQATRERKCKILIASTIADEGLDIPAISCVILGGGGRSSTRAFQRIGRAIRLYTNPETSEEKKMATIFDFCDYTPQLRRHARIRDKMYKQEPEWDIKNFPEHLLNFDLPKIK